MKLWKSKWKRELDKATPKLSADVINQPINVTQSSQTENKPASVVKRKPFVYSMSAAVAVVLIAVVLCATLITPVGKVETFAFTVEINPSVVISTDGTGCVTGIVSSNQDADVVLSSADLNEVVGKSLSEVINWYVDRASMLGYLDIDSLSAVRVTSVEGGADLLNTACADLERFLQNKGIMSVVLADELNVSAFVQRCGLQGNISTVEEIAQYIATARPLMYDRNADGQTSEQLTAQYKEFVQDDAFIQSVRTFLRDIVDGVNGRKRDIAEINTLYDEIYNHQDNLGILSRDYWNVKIYDGTGRYTAEFGALMKKMDCALSAYQSNYGVNITNKIQLEALSATLESLPIDEVADLLDRLTVTVLNQSLPLVSHVLSSIGENDIIADFLTLPNNVAEYIDKVASVLLMEYNTRIKQFAEVYNAERNSISAAEYDLCKQELLSKYGSAENLWNNLK